MRNALNLPTEKTMTQLLLVGDSLVAEYDWQRRISDCTVHNFGSPGIVAADLLGNLPDIKKSVPHADIVMVMVGTNDILTGNFAFIHTLKKIYVQLSHNYPTAEIIGSSLLPMVLPHLPDNTVPSLNCHIEAVTMQTGSCFLDTHKRFLSASTTLFQEDGVHLTPAGYEVWSRALLEHIAFLMEND